VALYNYASVTLLPQVQPGISPVFQTYLAQQLVRGGLYQKGEPIFQGCWQVDLTDQLKPAVSVYAVSLADGRTIFATTGPWKDEGDLNLVAMALKIDTPEEAVRYHLYLVALASEREKQQLRGASSTMARYLKLRKQLQLPEQAIDWLAGTMPPQLTTQERLDYFRLGFLSW